MTGQKPIILWKPNLYWNEKKNQEKSGKIEEPYVPLSQRYRHCPFQDSPCFLPISVTKIKTIHLSSTRTRKLGNWFVMSSYIKHLTRAQKKGYLGTPLLILLLRLVGLGVSICAAAGRDLPHYILRGNDSWIFILFLQVKSTKSAGPTKPTYQSKLKIPFCLKQKKTHPHMRIFWPISNYFFLG